MSLKGAQTIEPISRWHTAAASQMVRWSNERALCLYGPVIFLEPVYCVQTGSLF